MYVRIDGRVLFKPTLLHERLQLKGNDFIWFYSAATVDIKIYILIHLIERQNDIRLSLKLCRRPRHDSTVRCISIPVWLWIVALNCIVFRMPPPSPHSAPFVRPVATSSCKFNRTRVYNHPACLCTSGERPLRSLIIFFPRFGKVTALCAH